MCVLLAAFLRLLATKRATNRALLSEYNLKLSASKATGFPVKVYPQQHYNPKAHEA